MRLALTWIPALTLLACTPEVPPPPPQFPTCWADVTSVPRSQVCEEEMCLEEFVSVVVDTKNTNTAQFYCQGCGNLPAREVSTDEEIRVTPVSYGSGNLSGNLNFDNRALQTPTLENLRKYAREGSFKYNTPHGLVAKSDVPFEVLGYEGGRLHIRIQEEVHSMTKQVPAPTCTALNPECTVICSYADSSYSAGSGEPVQFKADVFAPLVITPALN